MRATHGADLPQSLRIYAFGAALGGPRVLDAARTLARQSHIPSRQLTLVDRHTTYAHNDPNSRVAAQRLRRAADPVPARDRAPLALLIRAPAPHPLPRLDHDRQQRREADAGQPLPAGERDGVQRRLQAGQLGRQPDQRRPGRTRSPAP